LQSAWKETLAELTPGLAHHFNNALTGILALTEGFLGQIDSDHAFHEGLSLIEQKARQASQLVRQITGLYEAKVGSWSYHDVNSIAAELIEVLQKVVPKRIEVTAKLSRDPLPIHADGVELRQVLFGLAMEAVKATPDQGKLRFEASRHKKCPKDFPGKISKFPAICLTMAWELPRSGDLAFAAKPACLDGSDQSDASSSGAPFHARVFAEKSGGVLAGNSFNGTASCLALWLPEADFTEDSTIT